MGIKCMNNNNYDKTGRRKKMCVFYSRFAVEEREGSWSIVTTTSSIARAYPDGLPPVQLLCYLGGRAQTRL